jgi:hypothetical protein
VYLFVFFTVAFPRSQHRSGRLQRQGLLFRSEGDTNIRDGGFRNHVQQWNLQRFGIMGAFVIIANLLSCFTWLCSVATVKPVDVYKIRQALGGKMDGDIDIDAMMQQTGVAGSSDDLMSLNLTSMSEAASLKISPGALNSSMGISALTLGSDEMASKAQRLTLGANVHMKITGKSVIGKSGELVLDADSDLELEDVST